VALLLLTTPLSACGDDDPPRTGGQPSTSAPASGSPSETTPSETTPSQSPDPTSSGPVVEPASGPLLELDGSRVRAPAGWEVGELDLGFAVQADDPEPGSVASIFMANGPNASGGDLDRMAQAFLDTSTTETLPTRQPDTLLDGQPAFLLAGPVDKRRFSFVFGAVYSGTDAQLIIDLDRTMPADQQQAIVASVLATFEWR
jgi:hypothetical protein